MHSFSLIKQVADVLMLYFSLSSRRRLAIKSKWLTLDLSVSNPLNPSWRSSHGAAEKSSCWRSSTSWISGLFTDRSASSAVAYCVLKYFICCSKKQQCFDLTCLWKFWRLVYSVSFSTTRNFTFERKIVSQTVLIPSMRKNFVKADWFIRTSQIPALNFLPILFWIIFNLWI